MTDIQQTLSDCALFAQFTREELAEITRQFRFTTRSYARDQVVAFEEDPCEAMGIVTSGSIHIQRIFPSGKLITLETFRSGDSFGEALVFSGSGAYPATLIAEEDSTVMYIARADVMQLCVRYPVFLANFLRTLSDRILLLNRKIKNLTLGTVRQKVANYLIEEQRQQKTDRLLISFSRQALADSLGIPRPSLSRELIAMQDSGWIKFDRRTVQVLDRAALEQALMQ